MTSSSQVVYRCPECGKPRDPHNVTCLRSECQQESTLNNFRRAKLRVSAAEREKQHKNKRGSR